MNTYHKIQTVYKRGPETKYKTLLEGQYSLIVATPALELLSTRGTRIITKIKDRDFR